MAFKRGPGDDLCDSILNEKTWWQDVVKHGKLAIAIRYKSLNVYSERAEYLQNHREKEGSRRKDSLQVSS
jgi:hypothetical protein